MAPKVTHRADFSVALVVPDASDRPLIPGVTWVPFGSATVGQGFDLALVPKALYDTFEGREWIDGALTTRLNPGGELVVRG